MIDESRYQQLADVALRAIENLLEDVDAVLRQGGAQASSLEGIVVGTGPGSFTSLRMGLSAGRALAFALVSLAVPILRRSRPDLERSFMVPWSPYLPILAAVVCAYLALNLSIETWLRFLVWMILGFAIYFFYGYKHSMVGKGEGEPAHDYSRRAGPRA